MPSPASGPPFSFNSSAAMCTAVLLWCFCPAVERTAIPCVGSRSRASQTKWAGRCCCNNPNGPGGAWEDGWKYPPPDWAMRKRARAREGGAARDRVARVRRQRTAGRRGHGRCGSNRGPVEWVPAWSSRTAGKLSLRVGEHVHSKFTLSIAPIRVLVGQAHRGALAERVRSALDHPARVDRSARSVHQAAAIRIREAVRVGGAGRAGTAATTRACGHVARA
jgi:hypothetical protein